MTTPIFLQTLTSLLENAKQNHPDCMHSHQAFGALVSCMSVPDALTLVDILDLLLNDEEETAEAYLAQRPDAATQWQSVFEGIKTQFSSDETFLRQFYPLIDQEPGSDLADWCDGYLQAYFYCEDIWEEVFSEIKQHDSSQEFSEIGEDYEVLLRMISSFSNWKEALIAEPSLAEIADSMNDIHQEIFRGVHYYFDVGQEMLAAYAELDQTAQTPYVKDIKIGRNDPCFCGSGKKYKQCCLN